MLKFAITAAALVVAGLVVTSAQAQEYRWCLQGRGPGYPGDCNYATRAQCQAAASGRNVGCGINPRTAFDRQHPRIRR